MATLQSILAKGKKSAENATKKAIQAGEAIGEATKE